MALHLVTGYAGKTHITAADHGALNAGVFGNKDYVVNTGNNFSAVPITANTIKILDGEVILHGRHIRMEAGDYEEVTVENGTADQKRNDLICIRYVKDSETGIESASCVVVKGTPDSSSPVDPAYNEGSILEGTLTVDFPLYRVPLDGLNVGELVPLFEAHDSLADRMAEAEKKAADLESSKAEKTDLEAILNGTTPVGKAKDADTVDGYHASGFAKSTTFYDSGDFVGMQNKRDNVLRRLQLHGENLQLWVSTDNGSTWTQKALFINSTGGKLTGALEVSLDGNGKAQFFGNGATAFMTAVNSGGTINRQARVKASGDIANCMDIYDSINKVSHTVLHTGNSNAVIFTQSSTTAPSDTTALWAHLD